MIIIIIPGSWALYSSIPSMMSVTSFLYLSKKRKCARLSHFKYESFFHPS